MRPLLALTGLLTFTFSVALANNPEIAALRQQVKVLRAEQGNLVKVIKAQYNSIIDFAKLEETQLKELRAELRAQERQYLSLTANPEQKKNIRRNYNLLTRVLGGEVKLDAAGIRQLRQQETLHVRLIQNVYRAKILQVEEVIQAANKVNAATKGRKK